MYKNDIGINAGAIWSLLEEKGALSIMEIGELTNYKEAFIFLALGWLSREDKICFFDKDGIVYIELKNKFHEGFY